MKKLLIFVGILAMALSLSVTPAFAYDWHGGGDDDVTVSNKNSAYVSNNVGASSNTGSNTANGGDASDGAGDGGDVKHSDDGNTGGDGGNGGNAGDGGYVETGNATTVVLIGNEVNTNKTKVNLCGCEEDNNGDVTVKNRNKAKVKNNVGASSDTGSNNADGGTAYGSAGSGGDVKGSDDDNTGGNGGDAGDGGNGGDVYTWDAETAVDIVNVVNRNVTRVRR